MKQQTLSHGHNQLAAQTLELNQKIYKKNSGLKFTILMKKYLHSNEQESCQSQAVFFEVK